MLIIKRKATETITIAPLDGVDMSQTLEELFASGAIEIRLLEIGDRQVKVAIEAPNQLKIWRGDGSTISTSQGTKDAA